MAQRRNDGRAVIVACALIASCASLDGQEAASSDSDFEITALGDDREAASAYRLISEGRLLDAREAAEQILARKSDSYAGHYLLAYVLHHAEGNLAQALYHLREARRQFEREYSRAPSDDTPWRWHVWTLEELASVTGEMDMFEEQLKILDARDTGYDPDWVAERGWPLMRLHRYDEARRYIAKALRGKDPDQISRAYTALGAIEYETGNREKSYEICKKLIEIDEARNAIDPVTYTNAASTAASLLIFDECERYCIKATKHYEYGTATNPWLDLVWLYVQEGRIAEALDAAREMFRWNDSQPPYIDEQTRAGIEWTSAMFLLVTGHAEEAAAVTGRVLARPDRTGFTSGESERGEAAVYVLDSIASSVAAERKSEQASWSNWWDAVKCRAAEMRYRVNAWRSARAAAAIVNDERLLLATLRPYMPGSIAAPEWLEPDLCRMLGAGVVLSSLERARAVESLKGAGPYFDALAAEAAVMRSRGEEGLALARRAIDGLPQAETMLRARMSAVAGVGALDRGDLGGAAALFSRVLQTGAGFIRQMDIALPCRIVWSGGAVAEAAGKMFKKSPRFDERGGGFTLQVGGTDSSGSAVLSGPSGEVLASVRIGPRAGESSKDAARRLVAELHEQAFAPRVDLTQADMRSLDGSTTATSSRNLNRLKGVVDMMTGGTAHATPDDH